MFNNKGVTLIELMFSLVLLLIVSLALVQTAILGINENLKNQIRDEAVNVVEMRMNQLRALPYTAAYTHPELATGATETVISRNFRNLSINFTPTRTVADIPNTTSKQIALRVDWSYRGNSYSHGVVTILRRE